jgi:predicted nucleic-acid-binding Zn-ribbon protein
MLTKKSITTYNKTKKNTPSPKNPKGVIITNIKADKHQPQINDELKCIRCNHNRFHTHYGVYAGRLKGFLTGFIAGNKYYIFSCVNCHFNMDFRGKISFNHKK